MWLQPNCKLTAIKHTILIGENVIFFFLKIQKVQDNLNSKVTLVISKSKLIFSKKWN